MTNVQWLAKALGDYENLEYDQQSAIVDYIVCPNEGSCSWDGHLENIYACTECKMKWLARERFEVV